MDEIEQLEKELIQVLELLGRPWAQHPVIPLLKEKVEGCLKLTRSLEETNMFDLREFRKELEERI